MIEETLINKSKSNLFFFQLKKKILVNSAYPLQEMKHSVHFLFCFIFKETATEYQSFKYDMSGDKKPV